MEAHIVTGEEGVQGSQAWLDYKKSRISASEISIILGVSPWSNSSDLWKRKVGFLGGMKQNKYMAYGVEQEPIIRERVNKERGTNYIPLVITHKDHSWRLSSLDGYDEESDTLLEIKCANAVDHYKAKEGGIPSKYKSQCMWQLFCSGCQSLIYASYNNGDLVYVEVPYDPEYIQENLPVIAAFYKCVIELEEPKCIDNDQSIKGMVDERIELKRQSCVINEKLKNCDARILEAVGTKEVKSDCLSVTYVAESESIDFKQLWENLKTTHPEVVDNFDMGSYMKKRSGFWKITTRESDA